MPGSGRIEWLLDYRLLLALSGFLEKVSPHGISGNMCHADVCVTKWTPALSPRDFCKTPLAPRIAFPLSPRPVACEPRLRPRRGSSLSSPKSPSPSSIARRWPGCARRVENSPCTSRKHPTAPTGRRRDPPRETGRVPLVWVARPCSDYKLFTKSQTHASAATVRHVTRGALAFACYPHSTHNRFRIAFGEGSRRIELTEA